jgi:hypothetical protein
MDKKLDQEILDELRWLKAARPARVIATPAPLTVSSPKEGAESDKISQAVAELAAATLKRVAEPEKR